MPQAARFVLLNSPNKDETLRFWGRALIGIEESDAREVLEDWVAGSKLAPSTFDEFGNFAGLLRRAALEKRSKRNSVSPLQEIRAGKEEVRILRDFKAKVARVLSLGEKMRQGELTKEQFDSEMQLILEKEVDE
jgi:hypothetical protein